MTSKPPWVTKPITPAGMRKLRGKAGYIVRDLLLEHWDSCRVEDDRNALLGWVVKRLREGHRADRIIQAYRRGLRHAHALAIDFEKGDIAASYAFEEARRILGRDGKSDPDRVRDLWMERKAAMRVFERALRSGEPLPAP